MSHTNTHRRRSHVATKNTTHKAAPFIFSSKSVPCERHPERNEDRILVHQQSGIAVVFDGVGGSAAGEIASSTAARSAIEGWKHQLQHIHHHQSAPSYLEDCDKVDLCAILEKLITEADEQVRTAGAEQAGTDDLATTVAMGALCRHVGKNNYTLVYAHVGDSRVYLLRGQEPLKRLTSDDGLLAKLVENQLMDEGDAQRIDQAMRAEELTDVEYNYFRLRGGITQALGGPHPPTIHVDTTEISAGDRILLCTDGIHDNLTDEEIEHILRASPRNSAARALVDYSVLRSHEERPLTIRAKPDDMSAIVLTCRY
ncbi:MAG: PP2C family serine/threonine-protein phosphatase [Ktedonobacteraceae bacterium]